MYHVNTDIDQFVRLVSLDCPGGPALLKEQAVRHSAIDFCKQTRAWREELDRVFVRPGDKYVDVTQFARAVVKHAHVLDVDDAWLADGTRLKKQSREAMDKNRPDWRQETDTQPRGYFMTPQRLMRLVPAVGASADSLELTVELVLLPDMKISKLPDFLYEVYAETVAAGAVQRLKSQAYMEWSAPEQAGYFLRKYTDGVHVARLERAQRNVDALNERYRKIFR